MTLADATAGFVIFIAGSVLYLVIALLDNEIERRRDR